MTAGARVIRLRGRECDREAAVLSVVLEEHLAKLAADPASAASEPAVTATAAPGEQRVRVEGSPFAWYADLPRAVGGGNCAPSPTLYLLGALAAGAVAFLRDVLAPQCGVRLDDVTAVARCGQDLRGLAGMAGTEPRLAGLSLDIRLDSPDPEHRLETLRRAWADRCPVYLALSEPVAVTVTWS
ncbi:OsmC family protein [Prauserella flavalba]|uniref:OsmC family protein n=1 Tax=Prauserella flavalba TaxID=1477506 RepID=UPI001FE7CF26|nr:OsmC family protein [Prauserella flavalba]